MINLEDRLRLTALALSLRPMQVMQVASRHVTVFDPRLSLAVGMQSQPGVYALLLGSGLSSAAGVPTGWGMVTELTARVAAMRFGSEAADAAREDPDAWWSQNISGRPLTYSGLLADLAPTGAGRAALLSEFFTPSDDDIADGRKVPTDAHHAIAQLVRRGLVKVIVTTNFDRLLEQALAAAGVTGAVVLSTESGFQGAPPLSHPPCVVLKIHGDFADLSQRNTTEELATYSPALDAMLDRVFAEYGLLVCGWSGVSDTALRAALARTGVCRYPTYFSARGQVAVEAKQLMTTRDATEITGTGADELFTSLVDDVTALDGLRHAPLSTAVKTARLKSGLLEPRRRIQIHDTMRSAVAEVIDIEHGKGLDRFNNLSAGALTARLDSDLTTTASQCRDLLTLLATGVYHDADNVHLDLWVDVIERLLDLRRPFTGTYTDIADALRHLPVALALRTAGAAAALSGNETALATLLTRPRWTTLSAPRSQVSAAVGVYEWEMFRQDRALASSLPMVANTSTAWPVSMIMRQLIHPALVDVEPDHERLDAAVDYYEYVTQLSIQALNGPYFLASGPWVEPLRYQREDAPLAVEQRFIHAGANMWTEALGIDDILDVHVEQLHNTLVDFAKRRS